ncbi:hypothetical protein PV04_00138 [Phialophora macrospora]|uniref:Zn(2)-C6 fungal-type domain-containing protein n=1 Tax=Phialophora macrospora TaxID=1851006 RepID=A0A0D2D359_9EURO|nr:hypothetical protein PV04_00138 [Phialophora macrospora]
MGRTRRYRVRFANSTTFNVPSKELRLATTDDQTAPSRSRTTCYSCRVRHIKCDEKFPVCTQCSAKGLVCTPKGRPTQWQLEIPWLHSRELVAMPGVNRRLLQYWLVNVCQVMTLDPDNNPMSFPMVEQFANSEALVHSLQSVSAGYEFFYDPIRISTSIEERGKALYAIRQEIQSSTAVRVQSFLAVWMLGISSQWIDYSVSVFGQEHLMAARSILDGLLQQSDFPADHPFRPMIVGAFIWWDMACSLLVDPSKQKPLDTPEIYSAVISLRGTFCTLVSHATELFYHLCCLGRYCRALLEFGTKDLDFEDHIEQELLLWEHSSEAEPLMLLNESFRLHGMIMLYSLCHRNVGIDSEDYIRNCSRTILHNISQISTDSPLFKFFTIPLLSAGAELSDHDQLLRTQVVEWFAVLYSLSRLPTNKWATELLCDLWARKDAGEQINWLQLMVQKGWALMLG